MHYQCTEKFELLAAAMAYVPQKLCSYLYKSHQLPFKLALGTGGDINVAFGGILGMPTALLINKQGRIIKRIVGEPDFVKLHSAIAKALRNLE